MKTYIRCRMRRVMRIMSFLISDTDLDSMFDTIPLETRKTMEGTRKKDYDLFQ